MDYKKINSKKGVAGTEVLLSLIAAIFTIGILVMAFVLAGAKLIEQTTDTTAINAINDTSTAISSVTDWFSTFIVFGAIVVLILLIVLMVRAIRQSGLMGGA